MGLNEYVDILMQSAKSQSAKTFSTSTDKPKRKKKSPEKTIENEIAKHFMVKGWLVKKINSGVFQTESQNYYRGYFIYNNKKSSGHPDLQMIKRNYVIEIEVKSKTGRQSESQKQYEIMTKKHGNDYYIVDNLEDAIKIEAKISEKIERINI